MSHMFAGGAHLLVAACVLPACSSALPPPPPEPPPQVVVSPEPPQVVVSAAPAARLGVLDGARWRSDDPLSDWHASYDFDGSRYTLDGYPSLQEAGRVEVVETDGTRMLLRFTDRSFDGKRDDDVERWIVLNAARDAFEMEGQIYDKHERVVKVAEDGGQESAELVSP
jgi:hypothetical protein